jgi:hypothetical protein
MILYQKSRTPYIIRTFFSGLAILCLIFAAATVVVAYFALKAHWPQAFGMWLLTAFAAIIPAAIFKGMLKEGAKKIVLVEIIPNALRILELNKDEEEETIIPSHDLQIDIITHKISSEHRRGFSNSRVSYHLEILGKDNEKPPFRIYESTKGLVEMLEKIEAAKIVTLKINEKELIDGYRNPGRIGSLLKLKNYIVIAIIFLLVIFMGTKVTFYWKTWFSIKEIILPVTWNVTTPEGDSTGYLTMKSDSTFRFRGINLDYRGRLSKIEATMEEMGKIKLSATDSTIFLLPLNYYSESKELTKESSFYNRLMYKAGFVDFEDVVEVTRQSDGRVFRFSRTTTKGK